MSKEAMGFYHSDGLVAAWNQAMKWAGNGGRIATLPEVMAARMKAGPNGIEWGRYYTTLSAEYVGFDREGKRKLVVAHGVGPMSNLNGIMKAYSWEYKDKKERKKRGGRITQREFWNLLDGQYGPVEIVDFDKYTKGYLYPFNVIERGYSEKEYRELPEEFFEMYTNKVLRARLGPQATEIMRSATQNARWLHRERAGLNPEVRYETPMDNPVYAEMFGKIIADVGTQRDEWLKRNFRFKPLFLEAAQKIQGRHEHSWGDSLTIEESYLMAAKDSGQISFEDMKRMLHICAGAENSNPVVVQLSDPNNCWYGCRPSDHGEKSDDYWNLYLEPGMAYAHLLTVGGQNWSHRGWLTCLEFESGCFEWHNYVRLVGVRAGCDLADGTADGPDKWELLEKHWCECFVPMAEPADLPGMSALMQLGETWFTQVPKIGDRMDTHRAEFLVSSMEPVGETMRFRTTAGYQSDPFFRFGIEEVARMAPPQANAYHMFGEIEIVRRGGDLPPFHDTDVQFYRIEADTSRRLLTYDQLERDYDKMMELMALDD